MYPNLTKLGDFKITGGPVGLVPLFLSSSISYSVCLLLSLSVSLFLHPLYLPPNLSLPSSLSLSLSPSPPPLPLSIYLNSTRTSATCVKLKRHTTLWKSKTKELYPTCPHRRKHSQQDLKEYQPKNQTHSGNT